MYKRQEDLRAVHNLAGKRRRCQLRLARIVVHTARAFELAQPIGRVAGLFVGLARLGKKFELDNNIVAASLTRLLVPILPFPFKAPHTQTKNRQDRVAGVARHVEGNSLKAAACCLSVPCATNCGIYVALHRNPTLRASPTKKFFHGIWSAIPPTSNALWSFSPAARCNFHWLPRQAPQGQTEAKFVLESV